VSGPDRPRVSFPRAELPRGGSTVVKLGVREVVVYDVDGELFALFNRCPHQQAPMCEGPRGVTALPSGVGEFVIGGLVVRCPWHGYEFDLRSGRCNADPDRFRLATYEVREEGDEVVVYGRAR